MWKMFCLAGTAELPQRFATNAIPLSLNNYRSCWVLGNFMNECPFRHLLCYENTCLYEYISLSSFICKCGSKLN